MKNYVMKKCIIQNSIRMVRIIGLCLGFITGLEILSVALIYGEMKGTAHDFSDEDFANGDSCIVCHAAHSESSSMLWNHKTSTANYQLYENTYGAMIQPGMNNVTRFCLSCHDGTVAIDSFDKKNGKEFMDGNELIGTDLRNHHAVSIEYKNGVWHLKDSSSPSGFGGSIEQDLLKDGKVECISCHNIHNNNPSNLRFTDDVCVCHRMH